MPINDPIGHLKMNIEKVKDFTSAKLDANNLHKTESQIAV